jgi:hypothetical protein
MLVVAGCRPLAAHCRSCAHVQHVVEGPAIIQETRDAGHQLQQIQIQVQVQIKTQIQIQLQIQTQIQVQTTKLGIKGSCDCSDSMGGGDSSVSAAVTVVYTTLLRVATELMNGLTCATVTRHCGKGQYCRMVRVPTAACKCSLSTHTLQPPSLTCRSRSTSNHLPAAPPAPPPPPPSTAEPAPLNPCCSR